MVIVVPLSVHLVSCLFHMKEREKKKASLGFNFRLHALVPPAASVQMLFACSVSSLGEGLLDPSWAGGTSWARAGNGGDRI